jgi:hypothetical protein
MWEQCGPDSSGSGCGPVADRHNRANEFSCYIKALFFFGQLYGSQLVKMGLIHTKPWHINALQSAQNFISGCI